MDEYANHGVALMGLITVLEERPELRATMTAYVSDGPRGKQYLCQLVYATSTFRAERGTVASKGEGECMADAIRFCVADLV